MTWLVLAGHMGAGKTSVGRRLAEALGRPFVDADTAIEERAGLAIPDIFSRRGELWFRRTEEAVVRDILRSEPAGVLALGGGALERERTRDLAHRIARVLWLRVSPEVAWQRVAGSDRPLAADRERFTARARARAAAYEAAAHRVVDADGPLDGVVAHTLAAARELLVEEHAG